MLSAIISVFQNHPSSSCLLLLKIWSMFHLIIRFTQPYAAHCQMKVCLVPPSIPALPHCALLFHLPLTALTACFTLSATVPCLRSISSLHLRPIVLFNILEISGCLLFILSYLHISSWVWLARSSSSFWSKCAVALCTVVFHFVDGSRGAWEFEQISLRPLLGGS